MKLVENYEKALQEVYDHVGFVEDWVVCPLDNCLDEYWSVDEDYCYYANSVEELETEEGNYYKDEIYTQRFYKKWIYRGEDFTMVMCDPNVDGMKWFRLFDNKKEII